MENTTVSMFEEKQRRRKLDQANGSLLTRIELEIWWGESAGEQKFEEVFWHLRKVLKSIKIEKLLWKSWVGENKKNCVDSRHLYFTYVYLNF